MEKKRYCIQNSGVKANRTISFPIPAKSRANSHRRESMFHPAFVMAKVIPNMCSSKCFLRAKNTPITIAKAKKYSELEKIKKSGC